MPKPENPITDYDLPEETLVFEKPNIFDRPIRKSFGFEGVHPITAKMLWGNKGRIINQKKKYGDKNSKNKSKIRSRAKD